MAYSDAIGDHAQLTLRTIRHVGDYAGRSRRTEVLYYWIASSLISLILAVVLITFGRFTAMGWIFLCLRLLLLMPMMSLFVRRLHDQDRSGWWAALLPLPFVFALLPLIAPTADVHSMVAQKWSLSRLASDAASLLVLVFCCLPGTDGANRFGADPRLEDA